VITFLSNIFTPGAIVNLAYWRMGTVLVPIPQGIQIIFGCPLFIYGAILVSRTTKQNHTAQNMTTRKPERLLTDGVYAQRRHPMYTGFVCLQAGLWFSSAWVIGYLIGAVIIVVVSLNSRFEETGELEKLFPEEYAKYKQLVPRRMYTPMLSLYLLMILFLAISSVVAVLCL